jgi:hypothetical protein
MAKVLERGFGNETGKEITLTISHPKDTLTKSNVDNE